MQASLWNQWQTLLPGWWAQSTWLGQPVNDWLAALLVSALTSCFTRAGGW
jgi:hypothetical protein